MTRRQRRIIELLTDANVVCHPVDHGRVLALPDGEPPKLIHINTGRRDPVQTFHLTDRWALLNDARATGAEPVLAWWPWRQETPEWIKVPHTLILP